MIDITAFELNKMAPNITADATGPLFEEDDKNVDTTIVTPKDIVPQTRKVELVWRNIIMFGYLHLASLYGLYLCFGSTRIYTLMFAFLLFRLGGLGITAGAHRLWSHRSYKAKWPLRLFLTFCNTLAFQDAVVDWARDHRVHHKYSETDADPHNANRGFFFSHIGWLLCRKHPDVKEKGKGVDLSDLYSDPILRFQKRHYIVLMPLVCFVLPTVIPWYFWGESLHNAWFVSGLLRYCVNLNITWLVNSAAHFWGHKSYDKNINPAENNTVSFLTGGEGFHNYHHTFPWDYKTAELGNYVFNDTTGFINLCAKLGLAYDLKTVPEDMIKRRVLRTGDGTHEIWGWGDKDQQADERDEALILSKKDE